MIYKKLLLLLGVFATLHAQPIIEIDEVIGNSKITFFTTKATKTWIGLYKEGRSNAWENVQNWKWVTSDLTTIDVSKFHDGRYEARLFYNNSFDTETSLKFIHQATPVEHNNPLIDKVVSEYETKGFHLYFANATKETTNWIGIYKKGAFPKRENLLAWGYLKYQYKGASPVYLKTLNRKTLDVGEYDMVYHQNDNYEIVGDINTLKVSKSKVSIRYARLEDIGRHPNLDKPYVLDIEYYSYKESDWVAIFKKDAEPIRKNIIAWSYMRNAERLSVIPEYNPYYFSNLPKEFDEPSNYKIVLFSNDSYEILGQTINGFSQ